jgi:hypothetical protein
MAEQNIVKGTVKKSKPHPKVGGVAQKYKHPKKEDPNEAPKSRMSGKQHGTNFKRKIRKTMRSTGSK